ncbi:MAG: hypothetical protein PHH00_00840 [Candidatus Nanoarchaeia archaeon]|nr:hypothetical protein [Candidatus Nanoarchaeia archaeon]
MDKRGKKAQIHISFGMIFSIIMIIIFIGFAIFAIQKFLGIQRSIQTTKFYDDLQTDINAVWNSAQSSQAKSYDVPGSIGKICFVYPGSENMITYDGSGKPTGSKNIENIDIVTIASGGSPCFENTDGKINLVLRKDFDDILVTIEK